MTVAALQEALFTAYFTDNRNIGNTGVLVEASPPPFSFSVECDGVVSWLCLVSMPDTLEKANAVGYPFP